MKKNIFLFCMSLVFGMGAAHQGFSQTLRSYPMKFTYYRDGIGSDTLMNRMKFSLWSKSENYPEYVKWKNQPWAVLRSEINGVGLFTDSTTTYATGDTIVFAFLKKRSSGQFALDYIETPPGSFLNDSQSPNMTVEITPQGILLRAATAIPANTELTVSYRALIALFPNDPSVERSIRYW